MHNWQLFLLYGYKYADEDYFFNLLLLLLLLLFFLFLQDEAWWSRSYLIIAFMSM